MLKVEGIETWYGAIQALKGISLDVKQGEIVALLGANGAGKSTTIMTITGMLKPAKGRIEFLGQDITGMQAEGIAGARNRLCAGGAPHLPGAHRDGQPGAGRDAEEAGVQRKRFKRTSTASSASFPSSRNSRDGWAGNCPEASFRCWPSGVV